MAVIETINPLREPRTPNVVDSVKPLVVDPSQQQWSEIKALNQWPAARARESVKQRFQDPSRALWRYIQKIRASRRGEVEELQEFHEESSPKQPEKSNTHPVPLTKPSRQQKGPVLRRRRGFIRENTGGLVSALRVLLKDAVNEQRSQRQLLSVIYGNLGSQISQLVLSGISCAKTIDEQLLPAIKDLHNEFREIKSSQQTLSKILSDKTESVQNIVRVTNDLETIQNAIKSDELHNTLNDIRKNVLEERDGRQEILNTTSQVADLHVNINVQSNLIANLSRSVDELDSKLGGLYIISEEQHRLFRESASRAEERAKEIPTEILNQAQKTYESAIRESINTNTPFNVQGYLDEFSKQLAIEIRILLGEVGILREERRTIQYELGELLSLKSQYHASRETKSQDPSSKPAVNSENSENPSRDPLRDKVARRYKKIASLERDIGTLLFLKTKFGPGGVFEPDWAPSASRLTKSEEPELPPPPPPPPPPLAAPELLRRSQWRPIPKAQRAPEPRAEPVPLPKVPSWATWRPSPMFVPSPGRTSEFVLPPPGRVGLFGPRSPSP